MKTYYLQVKELKAETEDCRSITFWHPISEQIKYKAGQFISISIPSLDGKKVKRSYSMSSSPVTDSALSISIKKVPNGFVSNYLNSQIKVGDFLECTEPMGNFYWDNESHAAELLLVGAGSGITPLFSIIKSALKSDKIKKVSLLYGNRTTADIIFKDELDELVKLNPTKFRVEHVLSRESKNRIDAEKLDAFLKQATDKNHTAIYTCGPEPMMDLLIDSAENLGWPKANIHYEKFSHTTISEEEIEEQGLIKQVIKVKYDGQIHEYEVEPHQTILEAALEKDIDLPYSCQAGMCTACLGKCVQGKVMLDEEDGLTESEREQGYVLTCVAHPLTKDVIIEIE
jgi:ring-1,2-phenylacetyl-CoA epoxidase subunit PaaE